jgi:hypothetical protein
MSAEGPNGGHPEFVAPTQAGLIVDAESALLGTNPELASALAISGGGIRSASFALGVMQALVNGGVMPNIHYLSTVSGGGYLGSSLTWFLHKGLPEGGQAGTHESDFPFGTRQSSRVGAGERRNQILDYIRQHANYLVPSNSLGLASFIAVVLRAMVVSLAVYFALLTALLTLFAKLTFFQNTVPRALGAGVVPNLFLGIALLAAGLFVLFSLAFSLATRVAGDTEYGLRTFVQKVFGWTLQTVLACVLLGALPLLYHWLGQWIMTVAGTSSTFTGSVLGFFEFLKHQRGDQGGAPGPLAKARPVVAAGLVLYGLALGAYCLAVIFTDGRAETGQLALAALIAAALLLGVCVDINHLGLHRMYRDRLMELFLPDSSTVQGCAWGLARGADAACIDRFCQRDGRPVLPYHIINTNIVLVDSKTASYRGRGGDNFILSPLYCGSTATGWRASSRYMKRLDGNAAPAGRGMTLPTAMAISGAAVNPNAGVGGRGTTRSRIVSTLLALLNLRLGYWAPNPARGGSAIGRKVPNFLEPGLRGGVLSGGLREDCAMVELSDGGHFENLAAYELIRRRVRSIFVCDGGQDGDFTFEDLANLTERVRIDFGAKLSFDVKDFGLDKLKPGSADPSQAAALASAALAARGFAIGSIRYAGDPPNAPSGTLIYFKSTLTPSLSADLYGYKNANPEFPHESTGDQFFDEAQFEAYRELGYHLGWQWLEANATHDFWKPPSPSAPPATLGNAQPASAGLPT